MQDQTPPSMEFALVVRTAASPLFPLDTLGWRILSTGLDPEALAYELRGQSAFLDGIGGEGLLVMVRRDEDGVTLKSLMSHTGSPRDASQLERMPRPMPEGVAVLWSSAVETHRAIAEAAAEAVRPQAGAVKAKPKARRPFPTRKVMIGSMSAAASVVLVTTGFLVAPMVARHVPQREAWVAGSNRNAAASSIEPNALADGGTVRRLQGIAQAIVTRY